MQQKGIVMKKILVVMVCLALSSVAYAQLGGIGKKASNSSGSSVSSEEVVKKYSVASGHTLNAHARLLSAVGLKDEAAVADAKARSLTEGTLSGKEMEETEKIVTDNTKALEEKYADEKTVLDEEGKKEYNQGRSYLAKAALAYTETALDAKNYKPGTNPASLNNTAKLAVEIGKKLPGDISNLRTVIDVVRTYSKSNNMEDNAELDNATKSLTF
jgi:hypothetical protein